MIVVIWLAVDATATTSRENFSLAQKNSTAGFC